MYWWISSIHPSHHCMTMYKLQPHFVCLHMLTTEPLWACTHVSHESWSQAEVGSNRCKVERRHTGDKSLQSSVLHTVPHIGGMMLRLYLWSCMQKYSKHLVIVFENIICTFHSIYTHSAASIIRTSLVRILDYPNPLLEWLCHTKVTHTILFSFVHVSTG